MQVLGVQVQRADVVRRQERGLVQGVVEQLARNAGPLRKKFLHPPGGIGNGGMLLLNIVFYPGQAECGLWRHR